MSSIFKSARSRIALLLGVVAVSAAVITIASGSASAKTKPVVKVIYVKDDSFSVARLTVKEGTEINWKWSKENYDSHNVTLLKGPKGVKLSKYVSATAPTGVKFERVFLTPGTYHFQCTIHPESMNTILTVKK
jgi:plastocyanin